jgi:cytochrome c5
MLLLAQLLALPCSAEPSAYKQDTRAYNLAHGRVVFTNKCMRCHESGRKGAPVFGDSTDWGERLEQPLDTMIGHAINGHGRMPARGDQDISDQDVAAAVAYVVDRTRLIVAEELNTLPPPATGAPADPAAELSDEAVVQMFLMLYGKDRWR